MGRPLLWSCTTVGLLGLGFAAPTPQEVARERARIEAAYDAAIREAQGREAQIALGAQRRRAYGELVGPYRAGAHGLRSTDDLLALAQAFEALDEVQRSLELAQELVAVAPGLVAGHALRVRAHLRRGEKDAARSALLESPVQTGVRHDLAPYWSALGVRHAQDGEPGPAIDCLERYLESRIALAARSAGEPAGLDVALQLLDTQLLTLGDRDPWSSTVARLRPPPVSGPDTRAAAAQLFENAVLLRLAGVARGPELEPLLARGMRIALRTARGRDHGRPRGQPDVDDAALEGWTRAALESAHLWNAQRVASMVGRLGPRWPDASPADGIPAQFRHRLGSAARLQREARHLATQLDGIHSRPQLVAVLPAQARTTFQEALRNYRPFLAVEVRVHAAPNGELGRLHLFTQRGDPWESTLDCGWMQLSFLAWVLAAPQEAPD